MTFFSQIKSENRPLPQKPGLYQYDHEVTKSCVFTNQRNHHSHLSFQTSQVCSVFWPLVFMYISALLTFSSPASVFHQRGRRMSVPVSCDTHKVFFKYNTIILRTSETPPRGSRLLDRSLYARTDMAKQGNSYQRLASIKPWGWHRGEETGAGCF